MLVRPPFLSISPTLLVNQASIYPLTPKLPPTAPSASSGSNSLCQAVLLAQPSQDSRLAVLQKRMPDLKETLNSHKIVLNSWQNAVKKEITGRRATISSPAALKKRVQHLEDEKASLDEVNHYLIKEKLSAPHNTSLKKLDRLFATVPTALLKFCLQPLERV